MCGDPQAPSVLIVLRVRPLRSTPLRAVSLPVWSFADRTRSWGRLRCLRAILLEVPLLSTVIASPSLFTWVPLGIFLRLHKSVFHSHCKGFRLFLCLFLPFFFSPHIPYHNELSEPVVTDYLKTDLITVGGQSVDFLLHTGATYSMLTEAPGPLSSQSASAMGLSG